MAIKIRDFAKIEQFIKQNPPRAMELSAQWTDFARNNPIVNQFQSADQFQKWADNNPQLAVDTSIWQAREIQAAFSEVRYNNVRSQYEQTLPRGGGGAGPAGLLLTGPLALSMKNRPELMRGDHRFKNIEEQFKAQWLKDNPGKDFATKEGVDYLFGSLGDENALSLEGETERLFREKHQKDTTNYDKKRSKVYKNPDQDPALLQMRTRMAEHAAARGGEGVRERVENFEWDKFVAMHPEKATKYATDKRYAKFLEKNQGLLAALARVEEKRVMEDQQIEYLGESAPPTVAEYQPLVEPSPDETGYKPPSPSTQPAIPSDEPAAPPSQLARQEKAPDESSTVHVPSPQAVRLLLRAARLIAKLGRLAALFANPVGTGVLIAIVLIVILTLIILTLPPTEGNLFPGEMEEGPIPTLPPGTTANCPVPGANITYGSYGGIGGGHCSDAFEKCGINTVNGCWTDKNPTLNRRAKSIDIDTQGKEVIFPTIQGQSVRWSYLTWFALNKPGECESGVANCGYGYVFEAKTSDNTRWTLHLLHLADHPSIAKFKTTGGTNSSGAIVGKTATNNGTPVVLHINIGKDIKSSVSVPPGVQDCDPGWIKPEDLGMCTK